MWYLYLVVTAMCYITYLGIWWTVAKATGSLKLQPPLPQCFESRYWMTPSSSTPTSYSWRVGILLPIDCILLSMFKINRVGRFSLWHTKAQEQATIIIREIFAPYAPPIRFTWTLILRKWNSHPWHIIIRKIQFREMHLSVDLAWIVYLERKWKKKNVSILFIQSSVWYQFIVK